MIKVATAEGPRPQNNYIKGGGRGFIDTAIYIYMEKEMHRCPYCQTGACDGREDCAEVCGEAHDRVG